MIVTLTLNPAVDQTAWVERLEPGTVHRVSETHLDPAGKGINVSRMARRLGWPTMAFGFLAGETGAIIEKALQFEHVQHHFWRIAGQTRVNLTVVDKTGAATSFLGPGPLVPAEALADLDALVRFWLQAGRVLVLAGSLPPGVPADAYAGYVTLAREHGVKVILDADGAPLRLGIEAAPDLIKPNIAEAERLLDRSLPDISAIILAAREVSARGIATVVISMGAEGAVCVHGARAFRIHAPCIVRQSTVGSGDSMVAGLAVALARGDGIQEGLRLGTAAGAATAAALGTALGTPDEVTALLSRVRIEALA